MTSYFAAVPVRPASRRIPRPADGSLPECWLLAEWPPHADERAGYWLSTLPEGTPSAPLESSAPYGARGLGLAAPEVSARPNLQVLQLLR